MLFVCTTASQLVYIAYVANGFMEYMECIGVISGNIIVFVCYVTIVFKCILLFENIDKMEELIDSSKTVSKLIINDFVGDWVKVNRILKTYNCIIQDANIQIQKHCSRKPTDK